MKQLKLIAIGLLVGSLFVGCSSETAEITTQEVAEAGVHVDETMTKEDELVEIGEEVSTSFILEHTADLASLGYEPIVLDQAPERIVLMSTSPFHTLNELGITDHIVAVPTSTSANYPEDLAVEFLPSAMGTIDVEKIISLEPDLVILPETSMSVAGETLKRVGVKVYAMSMYDMLGEKNTYEYTKEQTEVLIEGFAGTEAEKKAGEVILGKFTKLEKEIETFKANNPSKTYLSTMVVSETDAYANTTSSVIGVMLGLMGYENKYEEIADMEQTAGHGASPVNLESLVDVETDLFVFLTRDGNQEDAKKTVDRMIENNPKVWGIVPAVGRGDYIVLPSSYYVSVGIKIVDNMSALLDVLQ